MDGEREHYLSALFEPTSVAVFGVSDREDTLASVVYHNLINGGFDKPVIPINPKHESIKGKPCFGDLAAAAIPIQLAIIATPSHTIPSILEQCGEYGIKSVLMLSAGFSEMGPEGEELERAVREIAKRHQIRFLGPNSLGVIRPSYNFTAAFTDGEVSKGNIAVISQSGAVCTATLDWAAKQGKGIGFSVVISSGMSLDVDFGEILDYLITDPKTHSILLYVEGIRDARAFMTGLRAAARVKPVIVVKAGRHQASMEATQSHTGARMGDDDVFDAAIRRAGVVRGMHLGDFFTAAAVLSQGLRVKGGDKLAFVTNAGGPAAMACDVACDLNIPLANLSTDTMQKLNEVLPPMWSHGNPVDILGNADADRYEKATKLVLDDPETSGVIVILTPQAVTNPSKVAERIAELGRKNKRKPILTCWMGEKLVQPGRDILNDAAIPSFRLPETAVQGFSYLTDFYRNQQLLLQTPGPLFHENKPDMEGANFIIENALGNKRTVLTEAESKAVLAAFHIQVAPTMLATTPMDAVIAAKNMGFPVVMKILSQDICHKSDFGGVRLNITSVAAVHAIFDELIDVAKKHCPEANIQGVAVEPMIHSQSGRELSVGISQDPIFGPVITFGGGGNTIELLADRAVALPPLNRLLARDLISRSRAARLLETFRGMPAANVQAVEDVLLSISEIACEIPQIRELEVNPLITDSEAAIAVDARIVLQNYRTTAHSYSHTAIHPYPSHLTKDVLLAGVHPCTIRPIRPEDAEIESDFVEGLSEMAKHYRFMNTFRKLPPDMLARLTQIDYDREMALIAVVTERGQDIQIGVARYVMGIDGESCEFAIAIADQWQGKGLAQHFMNELMSYARYQGLRVMEGEVLSDNQKMLKLAKNLGFSIKRYPDDTTLVKITRSLALD